MWAEGGFSKDGFASCSVLFQFVQRILRYLKAKQAFCQETDAVSPSPWPRFSTPALRRSTRTSQGRHPLSSWNEAISGSSVSSTAASSLTVLGKYTFIWCPGESWYSESRRLGHFAGEFEFHFSPHLVSPPMIQTGCYSLWAWHGRELQPVESPAEPHLNGSNDENLSALTSSLRLCLHTMGIPWP